MPRLVVENLSKRFENRGQPPVIAVDGLSFSVEAGASLALVGPSGCGKTTTLRLLAGLERPDRGTIQVTDASRAGSDGQPEVALVFQTLALHPHLSAWENLALPLQIRKTRTADVKSRVAEVAQLLGIAALLDRRPEQLSGGERQRIALGRALIGRPSILLLDEPFAGLDYPRRAELRQLLAKLRRDLGLTIVHVTHDQSEALAVGDHLAVMQSGRFEQVGLPQEVFNRPQSLFVARFVGSPPMNLLLGWLSIGPEQMTFAIDGAPESSLSLRRPANLAGATGTKRQVWLAIRPERVEAAAGSGALTVVVQDREFWGPNWLLHANVGVARLSWWQRDPAPAVGQSIALQLPSEACQWFDAGTGRAL